MHEMVKADANRLEDEKAELQTRLDITEVSLSEATAKLETRREKGWGLKAANEMLQQEKKQIEKTTRNLQLDVEPIKAENTMLRNKLIQLQGKLEAKKEQLDTKDSEVDELAQKTVRLEQEIVVLRAQIQTASVSEFSDPATELL
jgi:chromosome segregation ATPase